MSGLRGRFRGSTVRDGSRTQRAAGSTRLPGLCDLARTRRRRRQRGRAARGSDAAEAEASLGTCWKYRRFGYGCSRMGTGGENVIRGRLEGNWGGREEIKEQ